MKNKTEKYAFFSIDVERFIDTECVYKSKQKVNKTMLDGLDRFIEILDGENIKATLFVLSDFAEEISDKLKSYAANGHMIALHGKRHVPPNLMDDGEFEIQTLQAKEKLEELFGVSVKGYRAPCFSLSRKKLDILKRLGFQYDSSKLDFSAARHTQHICVDDFENLGGGVYKKDGFFEFGISTQKIFRKNFPVSGGGYIRIANWFFIRNLLKRYLKLHNHYVFYAHPFEFSREKQPKIRKLKLYDKAYLKFGNFLYPYKFRYIIRQLKKQGYKFSTFEDRSLCINENKENSVL